MVHALCVKGYGVIAGPFLQDLPVIFPIDVGEGETGVVGVRLEPLHGLYLDHVRHSQREGLRVLGQLWDGEENAAVQIKVPAEINVIGVGTAR